MGRNFWQLFEQDRVTATRWREGVAGAAEALAVRVRGRPPRVARELVRAFSSWFQLVNVAEKVHRIRRRREYFQQDSERPQPGGVEDALSELKASGLTLPELLALMAQLSIEPVLLAHPMESTRRTSLRRQQRIAALLLDRDNEMLAPNEQRALLQRIRAEVSADWQTEEHPRERLTVADEREHAIFYLVEILYKIIPAFYQEIAAALGKLYGVPAESVELPVIVRFGTWVGGDMETSADVHAKSIRDTLARAQQVIINTYYDECLNLAQTLSQSASRIGVDSSVMRRVEEYRTLLPGAQAITPSRHDRMPYRVLLGQIAERLHVTYDGRSNGYQHPAQFRADIALIAHSLLATAASSPDISRCGACCTGSIPSAFTWQRSMCARTPRCITRCWRRAWTIRSGWLAAPPIGIRGWWRSWSATLVRPAVSMRSPSVPWRCSMPSPSAATAMAPKP